MARKQAEAEPANPLSLQIDGEGSHVDVRLLDRGTPVHPAAYPHLERFKPYFDPETLVAAQLAVEIAEDLRRSLEPIPADPGV